MTLWFKRTRGMDSETMRTIAENAGVDWDYQSILYKRHGIAYKDGDTADADLIKTEAESLLGFRPIEISEPKNPEDL